MSDSTVQSSESLADGDGFPRVAVFDLDGTVTYKDTYVDFLLLCLRKRPLRVLRGGALLWYLLLHKAGFKSNHWLKSRYLGTIAGGLGGEALEKICTEFCRHTIDRNFKVQALAEIQRLKDEGFTLVLATASFSFYVDKLFAELNMDYLLCTHAALDAEGRITGAIEGKNCIGAEKAHRLEKLCSSCGWQNIASAYSDDIVDLPLFNMADAALVVDPKPKTEAQALAYGFQVLNWR